MRKSLLLTASMAVALMPASGAALIVHKEKARAAFPGMDGKIAFSSRSAGDRDLYIMDADGEDVRHPTNTRLGIFLPPGSRSYRGLVSMGGTQAAPSSCFFLQERKKPLFTELGGRYITVDSELEVNCHKERYSIWGMCPR